MLNNLLFGKNDYRKNSPSAIEPLIFAAQLFVFKAILQNKRTGLY